MLSKFNKYIRENALFTQNDIVLVAFSGGLDSCVLVSLLLEGGYSFALAHMNFGLRGLESDEDQEFVHNIAQQMRCSLFVKRVNLSDAAYEGSTQMKARQARYEWFSRLVTESNFQAILTAHHADDNLETLLIQIGRGARLDKLNGIPMINGNIRRPLLFASRQEMHDYAKSKGLKWREDSSNKDDKYQRNYIRHHLVPELKEIYPTVLHTIGRQQKRNQQLSDFLSQQLDQTTFEYISSNGTNKKSIDKRLSQHPQASLLLCHLLLPLGFNESQCEEILRNDTIGANWISHRNQCWNDRQHWIIRAIEHPDLNEYSIEEKTSEIQFGNHLQLKFSFTDKSEYKVSDRIAWLNADSLKFPLTLRLAREGDRIQPLGMNGKKKISDLLIDMKVSRPDKERVWVIESEGEIVWLLGFRISHNFRLLDNTARVYRIDFK